MTQAVPSSLTLLGVILILSIRARGRPTYKQHFFAADPYSVYAEMIEKLTGTGTTRSEPPTSSQ